MRHHDFSARVAVVCNAESPVSRAISEEYAGLRGATMLTVHTADAAVDPAAETTTWAACSTDLLMPLRAALAEQPAIDFLVLTKGLSLRVTDAPGYGLGNCRLAVDSLLAAMDTIEAPEAARVRYDDSGFTGSALVNPFWRSEVRFSHAGMGGYLVTRLDGYTAEDALALIPRALAAEEQPPAGPILLDTCPKHGYADPEEQPLGIFGVAAVAGEDAPLIDINYAHYNADMLRAAALLRARNHPVLLNQEAVFRDDADLMGYASWGSNDTDFDLAAYHRLAFRPGAIGETAVSTSARTFHPTEGGQSLIADLIAQGITGVKGYTDEPFLTAVASPSILFDRYTAGWTLAEAFYAASRFVAWQDIVIGDAVCCPYRA